MQKSFVKFLTITLKENAVYLRIRKNNKNLFFNREIILEKFEFPLI